MQRRERVAFNAAALFFCLDAEAQEIAELVTLAEVKIGTMLKEIPKATANQYTVGKSAISPVVEEAKPKPKMEVIKELGFSKDMASDFQQMAEHEDVVLEAISEARQSVTALR